MSNYFYVITCIKAIKLKNKLWNLGCYKNASLYRKKDFQCFICKKKCKRVIKYSNTLNPTNQTDIYLCCYDCFSNKIYEKAKEKEVYILDFETEETILFLKKI